MKQILPVFAAFSRHTQPNIVFSRINQNWPWNAEMTPDYEKAWSDLNVRLQALERGSGLISAMQELETYHLRTGFIRDSLREVERHTFYHPDDATRFFRVQYNPLRARRFSGSGAPHEHRAYANNGCFLCRDNIEVQQNGNQLGYQIENENRRYVALTNPFPLLPVHIVIASREHCPQEWSLHEPSGIGPDVLIADAVAFADRMPGHVVFYNGVDAGASIPGHLHFQCVARPAGEGPFPLEIAAEAAAGWVDGPDTVNGYPLEVAVWKGSAADVAARASDWVRRWGERNRARRDDLAANIIASRTPEGDGVVLYFVPRSRSHQKPQGFSGLIGGLEMLGEVVLSSPEDKARLDAGDVDYFEIESILASVNTPIEAG